MKKQKYYTIPEICEILKIARRTAYLWAKNGTLRTTPGMRVILVSHEDLLLTIPWRSCKASRILKEMRLEEEMESFSRKRRRARADRDFFDAGSLIDNQIGGGK
ncbi:helix-turn-helix domain-containing protein [Oryzomonas rubra]|uniref:DNA-binding protein n=1 Tax=Oryzomonas rubra TaxID=2509454 RepID=A0A5A9X511_9BACT|nr:helix-turn-helix domain-containing protein [Oryzomonas rubra]KAA0888080.1 DNA-binding protein [Oryzomonas rubra]